MINIQKQQAYARMLFAAAGMLYLQQHAVFFSQYYSTLLFAAVAYFTYNALSLPAIKRRPLSAFRALFGPAFDIAIVSFAAIVDGGHSSGIYFLLLVIIFGNSFRYGNALLLYTQALSIIGLIGVGIYTLFNMHMDLDRTLLIWQLAGLVVIPSYVYLIGEKAERAIRGQNEAEKSSFSLLDQGPLPVFTYDLDDNNQPRILYANAAINEVFRDDYTRLIGEQPDMLTLLEDGEEMLEFCRQSLQSEPPAAGTQEEGAKKRKFIYIRGRDANDNILRLMCNTTKLRWREKWIGVCFVLDVTQRETTQAQLEAMHRQGYMSALVAGIVHDFRNILTSMIGHAEILHMDAKDDIKKDQLQAIIDAGERGASMVGHLLTLGHDNKTQGQQCSSGEDAQYSLENIIGLARLQLPPHIQLNCDILKPLPKIVCSISEIEQITLNLIHNAAAAIQTTGQINVSVYADPDHELSQPGYPSLCFEVRDDGAGIAKEDIDDIFKPFWTTRKNEGGSGLGLAMVQRVVNQNHGQLDVQSELGKGTCFTIHMPPHVDHIAANTSETSPATAEAEAKNIRPCRILLVDDAPDVLIIHGTLLKKMQHEITTAENGQQALDIFLQAEQPFDLIITDFHMPVLNGLEFIKQVRKKSADIPIILITAFGEDKQLQQASKHNVHLLHKPVTLEKLNSCMQMLLANRHHETDA